MSSKPTPVQTTKKLFFPKQMEYNGKIFTAGETYDIEVANGFAERWIKRGCIEVTAKKVESKPHTHTHNAPQVPANKIVGDEGDKIPPAKEQDATDIL